MDSQTAFQLNFDFLTSKPIVVELSAAQVSSDAGLFPFRQLDEQIGLTRGFAEPLTDRRDAGRIGHSFLEMVRMRVYGILAGYPDQNDHDVLRSDPVCKLICDRSINDDDLEHVVDHLREAWPAVRIHLRGDSGFGKPVMYDGCERLEIDYTLGLSMNARLKQLSENTLETAVKRFEADGESQRLFCAFCYKAESWPVQRWVVVKCEANAQGTNCRAVVSNRTGAFVLPQACVNQPAAWWCSSLPVGPI